MKEVKITLAEFNQIINEHGNINTYLKSEGFDIKRDWSRGVEKETGDYIFMQAARKKPSKKSTPKSK